MIGIISAMDLELQALTEKLVDKKEQMHAGVMYYTGTLEGKKVALCTCGVGKVNAAMHTQILIDKYQPTVMIQNGIAGSLSNDVKYFDIVIGSELVYHDMQEFVLEQYGPLEKVYHADQNLIEKAYQAALGNSFCENTDKDAVCVSDLKQSVSAKTNSEENSAKEAYHVHIGRIATGDWFVSNTSDKVDIANRTNALCTEMEGCAVAHTAYLNDVPFVVMRAISDMADDSAEVDYEEFQYKAADRAVEIVVELVKSL